MSKNIVIQEGGVGKQITVDKLKTNLIGGGACLWVPEDETKLGTKYITENGTYKASDEGLYGYSEVTVSGVGSVTGKDPDGSGDDAKATIDPETGEITITKIPSRIEVITPPANPYGTYKDGQAITTDGMVVKAFLSSGGEWGTVSNGEIALNPTIAVYDKSSDRPAGGTATSELDTSLVQPISFISRAQAKRQDGTVYEEYVSSAIAGYNLPGASNMLFASASYPCAEGIRYAPDGSEISRDPIASSTYTHDGKTVYHNVRGSAPGYAESFGVPINAISDSGSIGNAAWTMIYGSIDSHAAGSPQTITVSWPRPGDGKVLETTFEILVAPGYTPGGDE